eukprot:s1601_g5.t3
MSAALPSFLRAALLGLLVPAAVSQCLGNGTHPSMRKNLVNPVTGESYPVGITIGNWAAAYATSYMAGILIQDLLGFNVTYTVTTGQVESYFSVAGCLTPNNSSDRGCGAEGPSVAWHAEKPLAEPATDVSLQHLKSTQSRAQDVRSRSNGLRERVREQAKALQRGVGIEKPSIQSQAFLPAQEAATRIEAEASRLSQCHSASEVLERWLALLRTAPRRYTDGKGQLRQLSFKQVFLRSRALELALDASARNAELRTALRTYALAAPARWPESCPPPMAFARAFVALLWSTVGPTEKWLQLLGTLLSSEQTPHVGNEAEEGHISGCQTAEENRLEPCHTWLVQLIAGQRQNWMVSDVVDREAEILALEEKAIDALKEAEDGGHSTFSDELRRLSTLSSAVSAVESMAERRSSLAEDVERAILAEKEQDEVYEKTLASVATSAKALANSLSSDAVHANGMSERAQLCSKSDVIKERLSELTPDMERLAQEIAAAEEVQSELMQQLKQNKEHIESLRRQRDVRRKEEEHLHQTLQRTEKKLATHLASEDAERQRCEASQALAFAVADVAEHLKAKQPENGSSADAEAAPLTATSTRNVRQQKELLLLLATGEVRRLKKATEVGKEALPLAQEFAAKQGEASDAEAENAEDAKERSANLQDLRQCIRALKNSRAEKILSMLEERWKDSAEGGHGSHGLAADLRNEVQKSRELLEALEAIQLPLDEERDCWEVVDDHDSNEAFLFGAEHSQERESSGWDASGLKNLFNGFAARAVGSSASTGDSGDDPFLLEGLEAPSQKAPKAQAAPDCAKNQGSPDTDPPENIEKEVPGTQTPAAGVDTVDTEGSPPLEQVCGHPTAGSPDSDPPETPEKEVCSNLLTAGSPDSDPPETPEKEVCSNLLTAGTPDSDPPETLEKEVCSNLLTAGTPDSDPPETLEKEVCSNLLTAGSRDKLVPPKTLEQVGDDLPIEGTTDSDPPKTLEKKGPPSGSELRLMYSLDGKAQRRSREPGAAQQAEGLGFMPTPPPRPPVNPAPRRPTPLAPDRVVAAIASAVDTGSSTAEGSPLSWLACQKHRMDRLLLGLQSASEDVALRVYHCTWWADQQPFHQNPAMLPRSLRWLRAGTQLPKARWFAANVYQELKRPNVLYEELKLKFGYMGVVNHKEVGVWDLFAILRGVRNKGDLGFALQTMNLFYNFGVKLKHREISTRLLAATMLAREESEAIELIKLYGSWLEHPPDSAVVYAVMSKFLDEKKPMEVRELAKLVREDWRFRLQAPLYSLAIQAMLQLPKEQEPLRAAMILREDAIQMGVGLPVKVQLQLLDESLKAVNLESSGGSEVQIDAPSEDATAEDANDATAEDVPEERSEASAERSFSHLKDAVDLADALAQDGHVRGGASAATLCSLSWLFWHLSAISAELRQEVLSDCHAWSISCSDWTWSNTLEAACANFHSQQGFSSQLPRGLFQLLEASEDPEAQRLVERCRRCFGRFYPRA